MPQPNQQIPIDPPGSKPWVPQSRRDPLVFGEQWPEHEKLTPQQIDDFRRVGKITEEEAAQLLAEYNGHTI